MRERTDRNKRVEIAHDQPAAPHDLTGAPPRPEAPSAPIAIPKSPLRAAYRDIYEIKPAEKDENILAHDNRTKPSGGSGKPEFNPYTNGAFERFKDSTQIDKSSLSGSDSTHSSSSGFTYNEFGSRYVSPETSRSGSPSENSESEGDVYYSAVGSTTHSKSAGSIPESLETDSTSLVSATDYDLRSFAGSKRESVHADEAAQLIPPDKIREFMQKDPVTAVDELIAVVARLPLTDNDLDTKLHENTPSRSALDSTEDGKSRSAGVLELHNQILENAIQDDIATNNLYLDTDKTLNFLHDKIMIGQGNQDLIEKAKEYDKIYKENLTLIRTHLTQVNWQLTSFTGEMQYNERQQVALKAMLAEVQSITTQQNKEREGLIASQSFQAEKKSWDKTVSDLQAFYQSRAFVTNDRTVTIAGLRGGIEKLHQKIEELTSTAVGVASAEKLQRISKLESDLRSTSKNLDRGATNTNFRELQNSLTTEDTELQALRAQYLEMQEKLATNLHQADTILPRINAVLDEIAKGNSGNGNDANTKQLAQAAKAAKAELGRIAMEPTSFLGNAMPGTARTQDAYQINGLSAYDLGRSLSDKLSHEVSSNAVKDKGLLNALESRKSQLDTVVESLDKLYQAMPAGKDKEAIAADSRTQAHERDLLGTLLRNEIGRTETDQKIQKASTELKKMTDLKAEITKKLEPLEEQGKVLQRELNQNGYQDLRWNMQANNLRTTELVKAEKVYTTERTRLEDALKAAPDSPVNKQELELVKGKLALISGEQAKLDLGYRALLLKMQDFDKKAQQNGRYPGEEQNWSSYLSPTNWGNWAKQNISGFGMGSDERRPTISEFVLRRNLAKNGLENMSEAYGKLMTSFQDAGIKIGTDGGMSMIAGIVGNPSKLLSGLGVINGWMRANPREAEMLGGNLQHANEILKKGGTTLPQQIKKMADTAWNVGTTRNMIRDGIAGIREGIAGVKDLKTMPPEMIALLDLAGYAPYVAGAAQGIVGENLGGSLVKAIANSIPGVALSKYALGALGGLLQTKAEQKMSDAVAKNRDLEVGVNAVLKGLAKEGGIDDKIREVGKSVLERQLLQDGGTLGTDQNEGGIRNTIKRYSEGLKEWWNKSTVGEKLYRGLTQIGIPLAAAGVAVAAILATGGVALPIMITIAVLGGVGASIGTSYAAKRFNDLLAQIPVLNKIPPFSSMKASQAAVDNKIYLNRMQDAKNDVASKLGKILENNSLPNSQERADPIAQKIIQSLQEKIQSISDADFTTELNSLNLDSKDVTPMLLKGIIDKLVKEKVGASLDRADNERLDKLTQAALNTEDGQQFARRATENIDLLKKEDGTSYTDAKEFMRAQIEELEKEIAKQKKDQLTTPAA